MEDDNGAPSSSSSDFHSSISKEGNEVFKRTRRRVPLIQRSLAVVLASLQGVQVVIELKNGNEITGTVDETDSNMNVTLQNVRQVSAFMSSRCKECSI
jgi:small nuclear ribonucleoprotein (snRNP)-like protein